MAGSITVSSITLDSDNNFSIRSNTGATILSANGNGLLSTQLTSPTITGNLSLDSTGTTGVRSPTANTLSFHTTGTEDMRLDNNGNLFLGATSSALNSTKLLSFATADQSGITVNATNASQTNDVFLIRNTRNTSNGTYNALTVYNDGASAYRFQLTDGGNIGLFGGQIKFPASQNPSSDANTLDDYEEGTWTPTNTEGITFSGISATYEKIGRTVIARARFIIATNSNANPINIGGLPFSNAAVNSGAGGFFTYNASNVSGSVYVGTTTVTFYKDDGTAMVFSSFSNKDTLFTLVYYVS